MKHLVQTKIRTAYNSYLQLVLGLSDEEGIIDKTQTSKAKFYAKETVLPTKNAKYDFHGVSPLKGRFRYYISFQNKDKAALFNKQFQSVSSPLSPLRLSQLCIDKPQD